MGSLNEHNVSLWVGTTKDAKTYPSLNEIADVNVDVAVIGAGIAGLCAATLLALDGAKVAVIEAGRVASGTTGYTTAKITSLHQLIYAKLIDSIGEDKARLYGQANEAGLDRIATLARQLKIDCDLRRAPAYTFTQDPMRDHDIAKEAEAAEKLGLPASWVTETDLPMRVHSAVRFDNQAWFHPRKFCLGLAEAIVANGGQVFEMTRALDIQDGAPLTVVTDKGALRAKDVVVATQVPFFDKAGFSLKESPPMRSYAIATRINGKIPEGMYINVDEPTRSIRPHVAGRQRWLIIGGEGHPVGQEHDTRARYDALGEWARHTFDVKAIDYRWSAQDYMPVDDLPYIGRMSKETPRVYVATGFRKWGITTGMVSGMIISDAIMGRQNDWAPVFDSLRPDVKKTPVSFVAEQVSSATFQVKEHVRLMHPPELDEVLPGEGKLVDIDGEKLAAYRDPEGEVHALSPRCTHMGCVVAWNTAELSWDCPCHGSRFDAEGNVIQGPATKNLAKQPLIEPETASGQ